MSNIAKPVVCHCNKPFKDSHALQQHIRDSPGHPQQVTPRPSLNPAPTPPVTVPRAVQKQQTRSSPQHGKNAVPTAAKTKCACGKTVKEIGLQAHMQTASHHTKLQKRSVAVAKDSPNRHSSTLPEQTRSQPADSPPSPPPPPYFPPTTPLDKFFTSFPSFQYNRALPPATSWKLLQKQQGWRRDSARGDGAWKRYQAALQAEVKVWFGKEDDIAAWHTLCKAVGIAEPPGTMEGCRETLRQTHVNIVDLIQWGRAGGENGAIKVFKTVEKLREYTMREGKIFPQHAVQNEGETNVVLRHLLRRFPKLRPGIGVADLDSLLYF